MMRFTFVLMGVLLATSVAQAQDIKICVADLQTSLVSVNEGQQAFARLSSDMERRQSELMRRQNELETWMEENQAQMAVLSPQARQERGEEAERRVRELQGLFQQHQAELARAEAEATQRIAERMISIVESLGQSRGCSMVLQSGSVLWGPGIVDLTEELIATYNRRY